MNKLKLGLPKGSLENNTFELFKKSGIRISRESDRTYKPFCDDEELSIVLFRAQEIPKYVESGVIDAGITGYDWICETEAKVMQICELVYSKAGFRKVKWVLAVSNNSNIKSVKQLQNKTIATEVVNIVKKYLEKNKVKAKVEFSWGSTEVKVPEFVDAIVELTETGNSLKANNLKIIDEVFFSTTRFIANINSYKNPWKKEKINSLSILLQGALCAESMVGLKMNLNKNKLNKILSVLPAMKKPTVSNLALKNWVALEVALEEKIAKEIIPKLKKLGAEGIIEYPLNKVIP